MGKKLHIQVATEQFELELSNENIFYKGEKLAIDVRKYGDNTFHILYKGKTYYAEILPGKTPKSREVFLNGRKLTTKLSSSLDLLLDKMGIESGANSKLEDLTAPMPGMLIELPLQAGDSFEKGESLVVLEAMKMENIIKASASGTVKEVCVKQGEKVEKGQVLLKFD